MSLPPEQRINMSLDDVIKSQKKLDIKPNNTAKRPKSAASAKKNSTLVAAKPKPVKSGGNRPRKQKNTEMDVVTHKQNVKIAKSVGANKAKRDAAINQKRGLNATGKPTKGDVKKAVNKQVAAAQGLQISFKPAELKKTTEKVVSQQIRAVLSRSASVSPPQHTRPRSQRTGSVGSNNNPKRSNPKKTGSSGVLRVKR